MGSARTQMYDLPSKRSVTQTYRSGVSLHSHTEHSRESLRGLPAYLESLPVLSYFLKREIDRYRAKAGEIPDFSRGYWRGPVTARAAYDLEFGQIERLGLTPMVSLTDHDNIDAGLLLRAETPDSGIPISVEWSLPFEKTYVHLGVHNMAHSRAVPCMQFMAEYTRAPRPQILRDFLEELAADPAVLIVLNHPLWDMAGVGAATIREMILQFLRTYKPLIHALEINGFRSWEENLRVIRLGEEFALPVVAGGDRHGFEPNAMINLTRAACFAEFAEEVRVEQFSEIAILPQYKEPLILRHFVTAWDIVREHPQLAERQLWISRVYVLCDDGI